MQKTRLKNFRNVGIGYQSMNGWCSNTISKSKSEKWQFWNANPV